MNSGVIGKGTLCSEGIFHGGNSAVPWEFFPAQAWSSFPLTSAGGALHPELEDLLTVTTSWGTKGSMSLTLGLSFLMVK